MIFKYFKGKYGFLFLGIIFLLLLNLPYWVAGNGSHLLIQDNLDANFMSHVILAKYYFKTPSFIVPDMIGGMPLFCFQSSFSIVSIFFLIFKPLTAYFINDILVKFIGFIGFYLFVNLILNNERENVNNILIIIIAIVFVSIPIYSIYGITMVGIPLLLYSFYKIIIDHKSDFITFIPIIIFPFYSILILTGLYVILFLFLLFVYQYFKYRKINYKVIYILSYLIIASVIVDYKLFFYFTRFESIRSEFCIKKDIFKLLIDHIFTTYAHCGTFYTSFVILISVIASFFTKWKNKIQNYLFLIIGGGIFTVLFINILRNEFPNILLLKVLILDRVYLFFPFLWLVLLCNSCIIIYNLYRKPFISYFLYLCSIGQLFFVLFSYTFYKDTLKESLGIDKARIYTESYHDFFKIDQFNRLKKELKLDSLKKTAAIGFYPTILNFHGYYTIDGYSTLYSKAYKKEFRSLISRELDLNTKSIKDYFDFWGGRAYLYCSELNKFDTRPTAINVYFNIDSYKKLNLGYIFSEVNIKNPEYNGLRLIKSMDVHTLKPLYIYQVI